MKLSAKISAAAVGLLLLLSQIFSVWNLCKTREQIIANTIKLEWEKLSQDNSGFSREWSAKIEYMQNEQLARQWAIEVFRKTCGKNSALYYKGEELSNVTPYEFDVEGKTSSFGKRYDPMIGVGSETQNHLFLEKMKEKYLLICYQKVTNTDFQIVRYRDVSDIYQNSQKLFLRGMAVALLLALVLTVLLTVIVKRILKPFYRLRDTANIIAGGNYGERVACRSKDEVGEVAASFDRMADSVQKHVRELAEANEKQRQLLGALAHELKTPMTAIQGYAELLQKVKLSPKREVQALAYIEEECKRLSRLSVKMLQIVELSGEEKIEKQALCISELFAKAENITRCRLQKKKIHLEIQAEALEAEGDEDLLLSFLINLIDNAAKASEEGSSIYLSGTPEGIFVTDEGGGIPENEISRITEPFYMVDKSRARKEGGAGLGLALCAQIARLHGGTLSIESSRGKGSRIGLRWK